LFAVPGNEVAYADLAGFAALARTLREQTLRAVPTHRL
jgi:hypothetical protein